MATAAITSSTTSPRLLDVAIRASLIGIVTSIATLGYIPATQPHFYTLMLISLAVYTMARGEELLDAVVQYVTSPAAAWRWAFVVWAIASLLWTSRGGFAVERAITLVEIQLVGLVFFDAARNLGLTRWILVTVLICVTVAAAYALLLGEPGVRSDRIAGGYRNPNTLAVVSVIALAIYCAGVNVVAGARRLMASFVVPLMLIGGIMASASLKGLAGVACVGGLALFFRQTRCRVLALIATLTGISVVLVTSFETLRLLWVHALQRVEISLTSLASSADISMSLAERTRFIREGLRLIADAPFFGRGLDAFRWLSGEGTYAHNNFVDVGVSLGLVGVVLYYAIHVVLFAKALRAGNRCSFVGRFILILIPTLMLLDMASVSYTAKLSSLLMLMSAGWLERTPEVTK